MHPPMHLINPWAPYIHRSGGAIASTIAVLGFTLVIINGADFLFLSGASPELPFGEDWRTDQPIPSGTLYAHFFRGLVQGAQGHLGHLGGAMQGLASQAPRSPGELPLAQLQSLLGVLWGMLYSFAFMGIVGGQITDGCVWSV